MTTKQGEGFTNLVGFLRCSSLQSSIPTQTIWNIQNGKKFLELVKDFTKKKYYLSCFGTTSFHIVRLFGMSFGQTFGIYTP